jgi:Ca-activated chloride channel family protein
MTTVNRFEHSYGGLWTRAGAQIPLEGVAIEAELLGAHIHVRVRQTYLNKETHAVESVYTFPLPADGTLTGFKMECNGRVIEGVVQEREQAFRTYDNAVVAGHGAALLEQERKNVFTANVGNLLPGEQTVIEVQYVQRVALDEGSMRVMIPTLVAPRYIPGAPTFAASGHGSASPTTQVPDADRITPTIGFAPYKITLDLLVDLGREVQLDSASHRISVHREAHALYRVTFANHEVSLDRDIVIEVRGAGTEQLATCSAHRVSGSDGFVALSILPDLLQVNRARHRTEVLFLIDTSGSMEGDSITQAKDALRVCLRHLREGDRFNILAFESSYTAFSPSSVVFDQRMLERADRWVSKLNASGGTELLAPMTFAAQSTNGGVIVLLTDGQVGNEQQILQSVLASMSAKSPSRVYSFGIGTNVSDQLLRDLARETHGAVEFIHPGERIEHKVVAQFARAIAPRVENLKLTFDGVELAEIAPAELPPLVDAEPWTIFARYEHAGRGTATLTGRSGGEEFAVEIPLNLPERSEKPAIAQLWAAERIRDFSSAKLDGRRAQAMRERIIELSVTHGVSSQYTSFVVVEKRSGDRRAQGGPGDTRVIPVNAPAGWVGDKLAEPDHDGDLVARSISVAQARPAASAKKRAAPPAPGAAAPMPSAPATRATGGFGAIAGPAGPPPAQRQVAPVPQGFFDDTGAVDELEESMEDASVARAEASAAPMVRAHALEAKQTLLERAKGFFAGPKQPSKPAPKVALHADAPSAKEKSAAPRDTLSEGTAQADRESSRSESAILTQDQAQAIVGRQLASGLWDESNDQAAVRQTARNLWALVQAGITTAHPMFGTPMKKAIDALLGRIRSLGASDAKLASFALAVAWLAATGRRTRAEIESLMASDPTLLALVSEPAKMQQFAELHAV